MKKVKLNSEDVSVLLPILDMQSDIAGDTCTDAVWKDLGDYADHDNIGMTKIHFNEMRRILNIAVSNALSLESVKGCVYMIQDGGTLNITQAEYNSLNEAVSNHIHFLEDTIGDDDEISISEQAVNLAKVVNVYDKIK